MYLLFLLILFAALGYFLANSKFGDRVDKATGKLTTSTQSWADRVEDQIRGLVVRRLPKESFQNWVAGPGASLFPEDFKSWLASLSEQEARAFTRSLADYANGLGYNLSQLVQGSYNRQPAFRQVFVEAVVVYSQAFRKAKQARQEAKAAEEEPSGAEAETPGDGNKPAGKHAARPKNNAPAETSHSVSTA